MSTTSIIIGNSGTGKTSSIRNMNPSECLLIQVIRKQLPFKGGKNWKQFVKGEPTEDKSVFVSDNWQEICKAIKKTPRKIIVIDDFQYIMANEFMRRVTNVETGASSFQKYNEIAFNAWSVLNEANSLPDDVRIYILTHSQTDEFGATKIKTIGKLLDEKIVLEGLVPIVMKTVVNQGEYKLATKNDGSSTVKTPMELFEDEFIDNDLKLVDSAICEYFGIK